MCPLVNTKWRGADTKELLLRIMKDGTIAFLIETITIATCAPTHVNFRADVFLWTRLRNLYRPPTVADPSAALIGTANDVSESRPGDCGRHRLRAGPVLVGPLSAYKH